MTAHRAKPILTPERVKWFRLYYSVELAWGVFHACLDDANWKCGAHLSGDEPPDVVEAAHWFDTLTPSQRRRLCRKVERRNPGE